MPSPDASQSAFCRSPHPNIRLLAPAGCGKTFSLLHRCRELAQRASHRERFLIVTFTRSATAELKDRLAAESSFAPLKGVTNVTTLNAYGWNRIRSQVSSPRLLTTKADLFFAMKNQLHPLWSGNKHLEHAVTKPGPGARSLMTVMDNMKSLGFVHTRDLNRESYLQRLSDLEREGLSWRITEQFELLTSIGVLEPPAPRGYRRALDKQATILRPLLHVLEEGHFSPPRGINLHLRGPEVLDLPGPRRSDHGWQAQGAAFRVPPDTTTF